MFGFFKDATYWGNVGEALKDFGLYLPLLRSPNAHLRAVAGELRRSGLNPHEGLFAIVIAQASDPAIAVHFPGWTSRDTERFIARARDLSRAGLIRPEVIAGVLDEVPDDLRELLDAVIRS